MAASKEFGWGKAFLPSLRLRGNRLVKEFPNTPDVTQEELRWIEDYGSRNGGWDKTDNDIEPFALDLKGKIVREVMTHRDGDEETLATTPFQFFRDSENPFHEIELSFGYPEGDEDDDIANWDACEVEVSIWRKDADNPDQATQVAGIRLGPYPLDTPAEPLAEEARANIPFVKAQLNVLPDRALSMYRTLKRAAKQLTDTLRWVDEELERNADAVVLANARKRAADAAKEALRRTIEANDHKRPKEKEGTE